MVTYREKKKEYFMIKRQDDMAIRTEVRTNLGCKYVSSEDLSQVVIEGISYRYESKKDK